jgi:hypothetical protein
MLTTSSSPQSTHHLIGGCRLTTLVGLQCYHKRCHAHRWWCAHRQGDMGQQQASPRPTSGLSSTAATQEKTATPPSSTGARGTAISTMTTTLLMPPLQGMLCIPLVLGEPQVHAWRLPHTSEWWSGHAIFDPTYQKNTMGPSTPPNSYRSTPPPSSLQEGMRLSWPTTSLWS